VDKTGAAEISDDVESLLNVLEIFRVPALNAWKTKAYILRFYN
jgi:hypothetical protein